MNRFLLILGVLVALFSLCSCEIFMEEVYGRPAFTRVNVVVYGNDYSNAYYNGRRVGALKCTVNDATQVGLALKALAEKAGLECNLTRLVDKGKTGKVEFQTVMENLAANSTSRDLTFIFFSGHGLQGREEETKTDYPTKPKTSFAMCNNTGDVVQLYTHEEFKADLAKIKGTKVVFADVCYSGGLVDSSNVAINADEYKGIDVFSLFWDYQVDQDPNSFFLTASRYYQKSYEPSSDGHGLFTSVLLKALGWDEEKQKVVGVSGEMTFFEICQYVVKNNPSISGRQQDSMLSNASNDVILFNI